MTRDPIRGDRPMTRARIAWTVAGLDLLLYLITSLNPSDGGVAATILYLVGLASFTVVGAVLITRVPENPIGPLRLGAGTVLVIALVLGTYSNVGAVQVPPWPLAEAARMVGDILFVYPLVIAFIGVPLLFPVGRLPSPRFRWVVRISIAGMVAWTLSGLLFDSHGQPRIPGDGSLAAATPVLQALYPVLQISFFVSVLVGLGGAVIAVSQHYRRGGRVQRQQVKWLTADVALAAILLPSALLLADVNPDLANMLSGFGIIAMFALPVVIGLAILRYRLYEIDRLISRTIAYAILTGILGAVFVGSIIGLQTLLSSVTQSETIAVAASTLLAFALFQPVRRMVQGVVDRRFDRRRYDGDRTSAAFGDRLRHQIDIASVSEALLSTIDDSVKPTSRNLWLRRDLR